MLEIALKIFITLVMLGVEVVGVKLLEGNLAVGMLIIIIGIVGIIFALLSKRLYKIGKGIKAKSDFILKVICRIEESHQYLSTKDEQRKHPEQWLYTVTEYINLHVEGSASDDNDVWVNFHIDSALLYPITEYALFVKLCFAIQYTTREIESGWFKIDPLSPLFALRLNNSGNKYDRYNNFYKDTDWSKCVDGSYCLHLGLTDEAKIKNKNLIEWIEEFRKERTGQNCYMIPRKEYAWYRESKEKPTQGESVWTMPDPKGDKMIAMLKIGIVFGKKDEDNPILLDGSRWIIPANNYRTR